MICIIIGTRPEIIKMSPVIRECERLGLDYFVLHTGQHYSYEMDRIFFDELELPDAKYYLDVGSGNQGKQTGLMLGKIEDILLDERPDVILVQGDTNTVLAGALAASKLHIKIGHVEAGLRSFDRDMPEEINRVITDHISDYLFVPTDVSKQNLLAEGITDGVHVVGNTIVDATFQNLVIAKSRSNIVEELNLKKYFLVTLHRVENVDDKQRLENILTAFELLYEKYSVPLIFPMHPRTRKQIKEFGLEYRLFDGLRVIDPVGYLDFLMLESNATLILTDSGGVQEEACILNVPCVTLRDSTERPETVEVGKNIVAGCESWNVLSAVGELLSSILSDNNPFGDGRSSERILNYIGIKS
ncbi:MAG: UDP-N-acetylglucosamine 2-epimerase (non-hydrolyzing) [Anaerolineales bacterium]|nr:UDP-N-acetylglucosamine 2-epimerase (non-hydrolyzing) [Anaerolineales bacterium]